MFWNDIKEIKDCLNKITCRIVILEEKINDVKKLQEGSDSYDLIIKSFISAGEKLEQKKFFKLDAIYKKICESEEEKPKKQVKKKKEAFTNPYHSL